MFMMFEGLDVYENGFKFNVFLMLVCYFKLGMLFFKYSGWLLMMLMVDVVLREIVILWFVWFYCLFYEWVQYVELSLILGKIDFVYVEVYKCGEVLVEQQGVLMLVYIEVVKCGVDDFIFIVLQVYVFCVVDQFKDIGYIEDVIWNGFVLVLFEKELIELIFIMGIYGMFVWVFNVVGMEFEECQCGYVDDVLGQGIG